MKLDDRMKALGEDFKQNLRGKVTLDMIEVIDKGLTEGFEVGRMMGFENAKMKIAGNMIKAGCSYELINSSTDIDLEQYENLKSMIESS